MKMLIEIDRSVLEEARNGNQLAFDVLNDLATAQRKGYHALWADAKILEEIVKLPKSELGGSLKVYYALSKVVRTRKAFYESVSTKVLVSFSEKTRRENNIIYFKPSDKVQLSISSTTLLTDNLNDGYFFEYIVLWYMRTHRLTVSYNIHHQPGGGDSMVDSYKDYATNKKECSFCLCIADSDIKADVDKLLEHKLINASQKPTYGETYKKIWVYDCKKEPFNCACYCFENVVEVENLIPFCIIEKDNNYKEQVAALKSANIPDYSYFDFKEGFVKLNESDAYVQDYWKKIIFTKQKLPIIKGFGDKLLSYILTNHKDKLLEIDDSMLSSAQLKEYEAIGKRVFSWCCTMSIARAKV